MATALHNLKPSKGSLKKKKRLGRGNASGKGNYSGHGLKGQKARSGVGGLKRLGFKRTLQATPKFKGQKKRYPKMEVVNLSALDKHFTDGEAVTAKKLLEKGLISREKNGIKILGKGDITKALTVSADKFSESAKSAIEKAGGKAHTTI